MEDLAQILLLLAVTIGVVLAFQRLHVPTSLGYLLVGLILGPHTLGPTVWVPEFGVLAEFGVVFLLFTIGLNFSLPRLQALRHQVLGLGSGQVAFTTLLVGLILWSAGMDPAAAFVFGAVFAQSSTTIIASLLSEQREEHSPHGRLGLAMSVFQDVTAVPFIVVIPVLGGTVAAGVLAGTLGVAIGKAVIAFGLVFFIGRWLLRPLFHLVAERRSLELFTLAVLLVALLAAWTTSSLGLSLAFGGFLAGMMLGETEFRHQVEANIRPFRDVLLGLFFIGIGMRFDPSALPSIWEWTILGALLIVLSKIVIVTALVRRSGVDSDTALRTALMLSVGGEFGLALVAIALDATVLDGRLGQIAISAVLVSMVVGAVLIRFNATIARLVFPKASAVSEAMPPPLSGTDTPSVLLGGYGRVGHTVAVLLQASGVPFIAFDTDPKRVSLGRSEGHAVYFGDIADPGLLAAVHAHQASLVVVTTSEEETALRAIAQFRRIAPTTPVVARARDLEATTRLRAAGATHAYPETIEASLRLGETALALLDVPGESINSVVEEVRRVGYRTIVEDDGTR